MQCLLITNNKKFNKELNNKLLELDKSCEYMICNTNIDDIKNNKNLSTLTACVIYLSSLDDVSCELSNILSILTGYLTGNCIPVITNLSILLDANFLQNDSVVLQNTSDQILLYLTENFARLEESAKQRNAKKKLLDRGIPFTSDCFATYIAKNKIEVVNEFLEAGMSVNSRDDMGVPMLNIACRNDNFEFVQMIFELGADLNASSDDRGYTAVMDAVWRGNEKITKYLIEKGADLNTINKEGQTNLILAVGANRENLVQLLVTNGADPDVKDMMGMSAYTYASLFKKERIVDILTPYHKN